MLCPLKEYEIKTKMVQEQWTQLKKNLLGWIDFRWEGIKIWWGVGKWPNLLLLERTPPSPSRENPVQTLPTSFHIQWRSSVHITYIMSQSEYLTSARFQHLVCHIYIYGIYFQLSVQCLYYKTFITSWTHLIRPNDGRIIS